MQMFETLLGEISSLRQQNVKNDKAIRKLTQQVVDLKAEQHKHHRLTDEALRHTMGAGLQVAHAIEDIQTLTHHVTRCTTVARDDLILDRRTTPSNEGQRIWREQLMTRRKLDRLFEMTNNAGPTHFLPNFRKLPLELRRYIWRLAVPQRMTCLHKPDRHHFFPTTLSAPAVAHVCRESRAAVSTWSKHPGIWAATLPQTKVPYTELWQIRGDRGKLWTWFTPETDILMVSPSKALNHPMKEVVQHVVVGSGDICALAAQFLLFYRYLNRQRDPR